MLGGDLEGADGVLGPVLEQGGPPDQHQPGDLHQGLGAAGVVVEDPV